MSRGKQFPHLYFINLDRRPDRRRFQEQQAKLHGLIVERVPAKDGEEGVTRLPESSLTPGARGLWITFIDLVDRLRNDRVHVAVVLEDDAVLHPFFKRSLKKVVQQAGDEVALIQLGYIGLSAWRSNNSIWENIKKFLRPRSRFREMKATLENRESRRNPFIPRLMAGTHCLVVFPDRLAQHLEAIETGRLPLDRAFVEYARSNPGVFVRTRRSNASQLPYKSDIPWSR